MLCLGTQSHPTLCDPMNCSPSGLSVHGDSPGRNTEVGCHAFFEETDLPSPGIEPRSTALQVDSLPAELPGKSKEKVWMHISSQVMEMPC